MVEMVFKKTLCVLVPMERLIIKISRSEFLAGFHEIVMKYNFLGTMITPLTKISL